jgi:hypothetical protein
MSTLDPIELYGTLDFKTESVFFETLSHVDVATKMFLEF